MISFIAGFVGGAISMLLLIYHIYDWYAEYDGPGIRMIAVKKNRVPTQQEIGDRFLKRSTSL